jgi:hypothetical protein
MTREQKIYKLNLAIEKGFTYDSNTGDVIGIRGKVIKTKNGRGYLNFQFKHNNINYSLLCHQFGWYYHNQELADEIDHINGIKTDNRICNIRSVTHQQNMWNKTTAAGFSFRKEIKKYMAYIVVNKKMKHLGYYEDKDSARESYLKAKTQLHKI